MPPASRQRRAWLRRAARLGALPLLAARAGAARAAPSVEPVRFGQNAPITGLAQHSGIEYSRGIKLAFEDANARGGYNGRPLELVSYDDASQAIEAVTNTRELLDTEKVFALMGYVGADAVARCLPLALKAGVPFIAPLTGDESLRRTPARALFHLRPGDDSETGLIARTLATMDFRRTAVLQQDDIDGAAALQSLQRSLASAGMPPPLAIARVPHDANDRPEFAQREIGPAARRLLADGPQAVICLGGYAITAAAVRHLREAGFAGGCYATSPSSAAAIGPLLGRHAAGLSITQVVPSPFDTSRPVVAAYQKRLAASGPAGPEYVSLEGWIAGRIVVEALDRVGPVLTRERFFAAMESLSGLDLGGFALRWDPAHRQYHSGVTLTVLDVNGRPRT